MYNKEFKEYITKLIEACASITFNNHYNIQATFNAEDHPNETETRNIPLAIDVDCTYENAVIFIFPECLKQYKEKRYNEIGAGMLHEFCHILHQPMKDFASYYVSEHDLRMFRHTNEVSVERTAKVINNLLPEKWAWPSKL